jgi:hypothetical protein
MGNPITIATDSSITGILTSFTIEYPSVSVVGKSPCRQVDCLKELDPNSKTVNVDTDFLLNPYKLMHEEEGEQKYLFTNVFPCTL